MTSTRRAASGTVSPLRLEPSIAGASRATAVRIAGDGARLREPAPEAQPGRPRRRRHRPAASRACSMVMPAPAIARPRANVAMSADRGIVSETFTPSASMALTTADV